MARRQRNDQMPPLNAVDAEWRQEDTAFFNFGMEDTAIPALVIVQATSTNIPEYKRHIGELYNTVTGTFHESIEVFFVGGNTPRSVLPYPFDRNAPQLCASPDSVAPFARFVGQEITAVSEYAEEDVIIPETCDQCPLFENPLCTQMYRYYGVIVDEQIPFSIRCKRTNREPAKKLNFQLNQLQLRGMFKTFLITTETKVSGGGTEFYIFKFIPHNDAAGFIQQAKELHALLADRVRQNASRQLESGEYNGE